MPNKHDLSCTVFVGNLASQTTREDLIQAFSEFGPVKRGAVVEDKKTKQSKGFGFIVFSVANDVKEALKAPVIRLHGKELRLESGESKDKNKEKKKLQPPPDDKPPPPKEETTSKPKSISVSPDDLCRVVLFNIPTTFTEHQLRKRLKKRSGTVVSLERTGEGDQAIVTYDSPESARTALQELNDRKWGEQHVFARKFSQTKAKHFRLIVRNLGFHVDDVTLKSRFEAFGPLEEAVVAKKTEAPFSSRGFGFVQYFCRADAEKAIREMNTKESDLAPGKKGGKIAVDYAVAKDKYLKLKEGVKTSVDGPTVVEKADDDDDAIESKTEEEEEEEEDNQSASEDSSDDGGDNNTPSPTAPTGGDAGVREGRTIFVNNLLFETIDVTIRSRFSEFGAVRGVKMLIDHVTKRPRGSAFVEFWNKEGADKALAQIPLLLEGRMIYAFRAVDKNIAPTLGAKTAKKKEDKRNTYLVQESIIPADVSQGPDEEKRAREITDTKLKLKSPNFIVSRTRLAVRNLNRKLEEQLDSLALKKLVLDAVAASPHYNQHQSILGKPKVVKCTVMREDATNAKSRSSGFGFVELNHHEYALCALQVLNNNPEFAWAAAGGKTAMKNPPETRSRLIVSFAVENATKMKLQETRKIVAEKKRMAVNDKDDVKKVNIDSKLTTKVEKKSGGGNKVNHQEKRVKIVEENSNLKRESQPRKKIADMATEIHDGSMKNAKTPRPKKVLHNNETDEIDEIIKIKKGGKQLFDTGGEQIALVKSTGNKRARWFEEEGM